MVDKQARNQSLPSHHHPLLSPPLRQGQFCKGRSNNNLWLQRQKSTQETKLPAVTETLEGLQKELLLIILKESIIFHTLESEHVLALSKKFLCFVEVPSKTTAPKLRESE